MATDLAVTVEDKPGELANLDEATGRAGINIDGMRCFSSSTSWSTTPPELAGPWRTPATPRSRSATWSS